MPEINKPKPLSEKLIHKAVMQWVRLHKDIAPYIFHIPNEGKRDKHYGLLLKRMGMKSGVFDIFIMMPRHGYGGAWIELKRENGKMTSAQKQFELEAQSQNFFTAMCPSIDSAIEMIDWYCYKCPTQRWLLLDV